MSGAFEAVLDLSSRGLGIHIIGGSDAPARPADERIFVSRVDASGAAAAAGIRVGDCVTRVGQRDITAVTHDEAVGLIKQELGALSLVLHLERDETALEDVEVVAAERKPGGDEGTLDHVPSAASGGSGISGGLEGKKRAEVARAAFRSGDKDLSMAAHQQLSQENHMQEAGQYVKAAVFGGLDGIITTFAVVASVAGANLSVGVVIIMGFSNLIADGISMGFGEYVSAQSERDYIQAERNREEWEYDNAYEEEVREMVELYEEKGFSKVEAQGILNVMARRKDFFIDHMMVQELGVLPPDPDENPAKSGLVMFLAFLTFGLIPLLSYLALSTIDFGRGTRGNGDVLFAIACVLTALALFVLGAVKSKFSMQSWYISGFWMLLNGAIAAGAAYLIGYGLDSVVSTTSESSPCAGNATSNATA